MKTQPTDEQVKVAAYKVWQQHNESITEALQAAVRYGYGLAAKPQPDAVPSQPETGCEECQYCGTSAAMPPCNTCPRSMQDKWEPKTLDRAGQWFVLAANPANWFGPVTEATSPEWWLYRKDYTGESGTLTEGFIRDSLLRIPPPPADAPADLKGWQCREPVKGEKWYHAYDGSICEGCSGSVANHSDYGRRRWIVPKPAKKPWPVGPFRAECLGTANRHCVYSGEKYPVCDGCTQAEAEAIALAMTEFGALVTALREALTVRSDEWGDTAVRGCDVLSRVDAAGFKMPEVRKVKVYRKETE